MVTVAGKIQALAAAAQKRDSAPLLWTAAFLILVLAVNYGIFTRAITETGDFAANSLLVQQAEHFKLLTGHYSRWHFMHPGPAFLYLYALGEFLFYDLLHLVPSPFNGQLLITILFNGFLLYVALRIFRRQAQLPAPLALLAVALVTVMVNAGKAPSMLVSNWMPDVLLFPFLLFAVSCASVLAGRIRDLPWLAFAGMLLIHAHVAQFLFVGILGGGTVLYVALEARRRGELRLLVSTERWALVLAAAIVAVFAAPALIEIAVDRPNNIDAWLAYLHEAGGARNSLGIAIGYFACFMLFIGAPEVALTKGPAGILAMGWSRWPVVVYWLALSLLFVLAVVRYRRGRAQRSPFLRYLLWISAGSVILFLYWSTRIAGGLFFFNGSFIDVVHPLAWFLLVAEVGAALDWRIMFTANVLAAIALPIFGTMERAALRSAITDEPEVPKAASAAPSLPLGSMLMTFRHNDWPWATGVANSMMRMGKPVCVSPEWGFMFSKKNVCPDVLTADKLAVATGAVLCAPPCQYIYRSPAFSVSRMPAARLNMPVSFGPQDSPEVYRTGFYATEQSFCWTQKHASLLFLLSPKASADCFRLAITGHAFPGRPMQLAVNGRTLGTLSKTAFDTATFVVSPEAVRPGGANRISLDTPDAGPVGGDTRELGFAFSGLVLRAANPGESCAVDPAAQPDYMSINLDWAPSCYGLEGTPPDQWRWCGPDSLIVIHNSSSVSRAVTLRTEFSTDQERPAPLRIHSPFFNDILAVSRRRSSYTRTFTVPPGDHTIVFSCLAARSSAPDPRNLVLRLDHFHLEPVAGLRP